jgi:RNA polymerase sigma factor (sigma-70 family)
MKGRKFKHWMSRRLPPRIDDPLLILESVKAGERWAIEEMVAGHLRLAAGLVGRYYKPDRGKRPINSDDLISAAFYAVSNAVQRIADGHLSHNNPTAYIVTFIHGELRRELAARSVSVKTIQLNHHLEWYETSSAAFSDDYAAVNVIGGSYPDTTIDIEEEINEVVNDQTDVRIVELLRLGYKMVEIAEDLKLDKSNVSRRVSRIRKELVNE